MFFKKLTIYNRFFGDHSFEVCRVCRGAEVDHNGAAHLYSRLVHIPGDVYKHVIYIYICSSMIANMSNPNREREPQISFAFAFAFLFTMHANIISPFTKFYFIF
jgi:hypothetical protein